MGVQLCKLPNAGGVISTDDSFSNPALWEVALAGGVLETKFFLRMELSTEYCTNGLLFAQDSAGPDESGWFSFSPDIGGGPGVYDTTFEFEIPLGSEIPVWIRLDVPGGIDQEPKDDIRIVSTCIRHEI